MACTSHSCKTLSVPSWKARSGWTSNPTPPTARSWLYVSGLAVVVVWCVVVVVVGEDLLG